jgi:thymidylate synthase (FAD)
MVMRSGHESVIEHSWFVFLIEKYDGLKEDLLQIMLANNFFAITERENGDYLVSGNARMWRNYFRELIKNNSFDNKFLSLTLLKKLQAESPILFGDIKSVLTDNAIFNKAILNPEIEWTREEKMKHFWAIIRFKGYTRAFTHQLVRHRPVAISMESQRYCDESGFYTNGYFVIPPSIKDANVTDTYLEMLESIDNNYKALQGITDISGKRLIKNEDARFLLPNACCAEIVVSGNLMEWHWILKMRCDKHAQWEIREASMSVLRQLQAIFPGCFDDFIISEDGMSANLAE